MSQLQASHLMKFSQQAKILGNGLVVIDFGSRIGNIRNSYQAGENWEKELFVESSSFIGSVAKSALMVNAGIAFLTVATPVGWVGLLIYGATVAGMSAGASIVIDSLIKNKAEDIYDRILNAVN